MKLRIAVLICGVLLGLLVAGIGFASQHNLLSSLNMILADPWGAVTLLDLGIGLLFVAVWIALLETKPLWALVWIIALCLLGNVITLVYLLWRSRNASRLQDLFFPSR
jgi:hypothetical protein